MRLPNPIKTATGLYIFASPSSLQTSLKEEGIEVGKWQLKTEGSQNKQKVQKYFEYQPQAQKQYMSEWKSI